MANARVLSFAAAFRRVRGHELSPREVCSCGCARTTTARQGVAYKHPTRGWLKFASRLCMFEALNAASKAGAR